MKIGFKADRIGVKFGEKDVFIGTQSMLMLEFERMIAQRVPRLVMTLNVDQAINLSSGRMAEKTYNYTDLRTLDGMPLVWLARILGARNVSRISGADLLPECALHARKLGWKIAIVGGESDVAQMAVDNLKSQHDVDIVAVGLPVYSSFEDICHVQAIRALQIFGADIVFICLGSPKQEEWYQRWIEDLPGAIYVGAGAAVDFAAGKRPRAPKFMQALSLEWAYRLVQEPRRLGHRYLVKGWRFITVIKDSAPSRREI